MRLVRRALLINDLGDFEQQLARSVGGGCVNVTIIHCGLTTTPPVPAAVSEFEDASRFAGYRPVLALARLGVDC